MDSLANVDQESDIEFPVNQLFIENIVFVTEVMIKKQLSDFHAPTSYFY